MLSLPEIKAEIDILAWVIEAPAENLPSYGQTRDFGYPHIEVDSRGYHYIVVERGQELRRVTTTSLDDLLYTVFSAIASSMGSIYASEHRAAKQDFRRPMFQHAVELMAKISPEWEERAAQYYVEILKKNPFVNE